MPETVIKLGGYLSPSLANGPGRRAVLWLQGCPRSCLGCCNPEFIPFDAPCEEITPSALAARIAADAAADDIRGISLSGGEPLHPSHRRGLIELLDLLPSNLDIFVFSGYTPLDLFEPNFADILPRLDMVISGPYAEELRVESGLLASSNQRIVRNSDRMDDVSDEEIRNAERKIEVHVIEGQIRITGLVDPEKVLGMMRGC
jgi:anaerobic ribonucleoside-triphosphate reductase activating protein